MPSFSAEDRAAIQAAVRRLLNDHSTEADVRRTMETGSGYDSELWRQLSDMGVTGLVVDEAYGGSGAGPVELELIMEDVGASLLCSPLLGSGVLAAALVDALGDEAAKTRLLPGIAAGTTIAAAALTGEAGLWTAGSVEVTADARDKLSGAASYVIHGQNASILLVLARAGEGLAVYEVDPNATGVTIKALPTFDHTLRLARCDFSGASGTKLAARGNVWAAVQKALNLTLVALGGEQAGGSRKVLEFTLDYAKSRIQFGRAIGSFQAIKHMASDLLLESESALSAARNAATKLAEGADDADAWISLAAFACKDAFSTTAATAIQMHGGVAFTWAHPAHLYLRRARADAQLFGTPAVYRDRYVTLLGG